jgi:hypothetical protein
VAVTNEEEFRAWLEGQPREVCVAIAYRAAMRVLPLALAVTDKETIWKRLALATLRANLTAVIASLRATSDTMAAASAAEGAVAIEDAVGNDVSYATRAASAAAWAGYADDPARAAYRTAAAASFAAAYSASYAAAYADTALPPDQMIADAITLPAELEAVIGPVRDAANNALTLGTLKASPWSFWARWYAAAMAGDPLPWELQEQVALIPSEIWEAGPEAVAEEIARIEAEFLRKALPQSERIVFDNDQALFRKETVPPAKPDLLGATLARVNDALDDVLAEPANGLSERSRETRVLRRMLDRYGNGPQRIEMDCTSVHRALTRQILTTEELPASEANLALQQALQEAAQGIRATHRDIAENRRILTEQSLRELSGEANQALKDALPVLASVSDEELAECFTEDILYLTEEMRAGPPRTLEAGERNPVLAGYDEKVRVFNRAAQMLSAIRSNGNAILDRLEERRQVTRGDLLGVLVSVVLYGITLL